MPLIFRKRRNSSYCSMNLFVQILENPQADVALAWLLRNPGVTAPIIGPRTDRQLESALHAAEIKLSDDVLKELDRIFPGPGGEAPEAYAW